ncbi:MAG: MFS transporter [Sinobacteraceae bacterium]|nr:MFS transporter [Nevskiaceae bacterium]
MSVTAPMRDGPDTLRFLIAALIIHLSAPQAFITAPVFVEALVKWAHLTPAEAGYVQAAESLGKAVAAISLLFLVHRVAWRSMVRAALTILVLGNLLTIWISDFNALVAVRFICGMAPGMVVPIAYAMVGLTTKRERNFGWLLTTLLTYGALAFSILPWLFERFGLAGGLSFYASFAVLGLVFTTAVPASGGDRDVQAGLGISQAPTILPRALQPITVLTLGFYFVGMMGAWAYFSLIAAAGGVPQASISTVLATSQLFGIFGGLLVVVSGDRFGRVWPISIGLLATIGSLQLLAGSVGVLAFAVSAFIFAFFWNHTHPYLLSAISSFDSRGRLVVYATVAQMCGVAIGPAMAARLLGEANDYSRILFSCMVSLCLALICVLPALRWQRRQASIV